MPNPTRAAIYLRISRDATGEGLGIERQREDCRKYANDHGWIVAEEYEDNDISAYRGKLRPAYRQMMEDVETGQRDAVIVYNLDRLTRRPRELEEFTDTLQAARVTDLGVVTGDISLGTNDGLLMARILAAFAANESARKSERLKRKAREVAEAGRPNGGNLRPFGYEKDQLTVVEHEAVIIRSLADRYLAGESLTSLTQWMQDEGVQSVANKPWRTGTLRQTLTNARIAGLRSHNGVIVATAVWPAIISPETHYQLVAAFERKKMSGRRTARSYLLSGMLRCGKCGHKLYSSIRGESRRYVCMSGPDQRGCGRLTIVAQPVEEWIAEAVLIRLDSPAVADALAGRMEADERHAALTVAINADRAKLVQLADWWQAGEISAEEWQAAREPLQARVNSTDRQLGQIAGTSAINGLVGNSTALRDSWGNLNLSRQVAIVKAVLESATILPGVPGSRGVNPNRIVPTWAH